MLGRCSTTILNRARTPSSSSRVLATNAIIRKMSSSSDDDNFFGKFEDAPLEMQKIIEEHIAKMEAIEKERADWRPGEKKKGLKISYDEKDFDLLNEELANKARGEEKRLKWTVRDKRCGALAIKVGMMPLWDDWGERHACTILYLDRNIVLETKCGDDEKSNCASGYDSVVLGAGGAKMKNINKPLMGIYSKYGVESTPPDIVREFRVSTGCAPPVGTQIHARHFLAGQNIDVAAISKGKGFQGAMKRHNFKGMPASHGTSLSHRALGSTGQCQDPGRVFKGKKMAGRMGNERVTVQNLRIVKIDRGRNLLYVKGAVPGQKGGFVEIRDAVKKPLFGCSSEKIEGGEKTNIPPLPTFEYDPNIDGCGS
eukprot:CAMPEP_0116074386 /NCGR_PEP_ID=MMETSP0322-20121206/15904_1 /TAXON_ID=163516 /ORGANISM="Leptocylindrus danicus var. apora, Strain B651" /LENGTH=368 /DNA_ID=CAMNT_0003564035 /DNA_START=85 /DNA_END=1188 /DNA_ORIENTATION=+